MFQDLPNEIHVEISKYLEIDELRDVGQVNPVYKWVKREREIERNKRLFDVCILRMDRTFGILLEEWKVQRAIGIMDNMHYIDDFTDYIQEEILYAFE